MTLPAFAVAAAAPFMLVAEPQEGFDDIVNRMPLSRADTTHEWPFSIDAGELACIVFAGRRTVLFSEVLTDEESGEIGNMTLPRSVIVTVNPFELLATVEHRELYAPYDSLETLIKRLAPFVTMGLEICPGQKKPDDI